MAQSYGLEHSRSAARRDERRPAPHPDPAAVRKPDIRDFGPSPQGSQQVRPLAGAGGTLPSRTSLTQADIPKDRKSLILVLAGFIAVLGLAAAVVWGFVAPAVDPSIPPVAADGEVPVPQ